MKIQETAATGSVELCGNCGMETSIDTRTVVTVCEHCNKFLLCCSNCTMEKGCEGCGKDTYAKYFVLREDK